jgi:hypothetical protein
MMSRYLVLVVVASFALGTFAVERDSALGQQESEVDLGPASGFDQFRLYYPGESVGGLQLASVEHDRQFGKPVWYFGYSNCQAPDPEDPDCDFPLEIQNWSACTRFLARYPGKQRAFRFRGAKAAWNRFGGSFEVYTGRTTVVIFDDDGHEEDVGKALREVGATTVPSRLRRPAPGSLKGKLRCQRKWL